MAASQPDIEYHPDETKFRARTARRLAEDPSLPSTGLPAGYPQKVEGPIVWEGKDWQSEDQWVYNLTPSELQEIDDALVHFKGRDQITYHGDVNETAHWSDYIYICRPEH